jgi:hypothetical protein
MAVPFALPRLCLLLADLSVVLRVQLAHPVEHRVRVAARRVLRAVFVRAFIPMVTFRADSTSDISGTRRLLEFVPVAVVARTAVVPHDAR